MLTWLLAERPWFYFRQGKWKEFSLRYRVYTCSEAHPAPYRRGNGGFLWQ